MSKSLFEQKHALWRVLPLTKSSHVEIEEIKVQYNLAYEML